MLAYFARRIGDHVLAHLIPVLAAIGARLTHLEIQMSASSDALTAALTDLRAAVAAKQSAMQATIDAAVAAKGAQDDAAFEAATASLKDLTASLTDHVDAVVTAAGSTPVAPAAPVA